MAGEVQHRDGVALRLRVGVNSGRVIAGDIGSGSLGYAATGHTVGLAQQMESAAPPGGVMLSESTARLVEHRVLLGEAEQARIKGFDEPVPVRRLVAISPRDGRGGRAEASLVGRRWEMAALDALADRTIQVPAVARSMSSDRRASAKAGWPGKRPRPTAGRGIEVFWTFCESHVREVPFQAVTRLLRAAAGVADLEGEGARGRVREGVPDANPQICWYLMICSASPTQKSHCPRSTRTRGGAG